MTNYFSSQDLLKFRVSVIRVSNVFLILAIGLVPVDLGAIEDVGKNPRCHVSG